MSVRSWATRHELALFFVLAFAVSWAAWPLVLANPASSPLMPFGPAVAALAVAALTGGPSGVWRLLRRWHGGESIHFGSPLRWGSPPCSRGWPQ